MECKIYNTELELTAVIQSWISLDWLEEYNDRGSFTLELNAKSNILSVIETDYYCGISDSETLMIIKSIVARENRIVISGYAAIWLLNDRISTLPIGSGGYAENYIRNIIDNMTAYPHVSRETTAAGITTKYNGTSKSNSAYERIRDISKAADIGVTMRHDKENKMLLLKCYKQTSPSLRCFSEYGNIVNPEYKYSVNDYKNVATVEGKTLTVTVGNILATGASRKEVYYDATYEEQGERTFEEYQTVLEGLAWQELTWHNTVEILNADIIDVNANLGDIAECKFIEFGMAAEVRIVGIEIISQNNEYKRKLTLGSPIITRR